MRCADEIELVSEISLPAKQVFALKMLKNGGKYLMEVFKPILNASLIGTIGNTIKEGFL